MLYQPPLDLLVQIAIVREKVASIFLSRRNVVACGIGLKVKDGQVTNTPSIIVSVKQKQSIEQLPESEVIPRLVDNIPTDVVETGVITALGVDRLHAVRPVRPGVSIGHRDATGGTLGTLVRRDTQRFLLSNNHVMARLNSAQIGDPILQPAPADGGTLNDAVATLAGFQLIRFFDEAGTPGVAIIETPSPKPQGCAALLANFTQIFAKPKPPTSPPVTQPPSSGIPINRVDAAIALPNDGIPTNPDILGIDYPPSGIADPRLGMPVIKSGRTTGLTSGLITQVDVTIDVEYGSRKARYVNQMVLTPMSQRGDSGALLLNGERQAVGLIFSGSDIVSIATPIRFVLSALRVELVTG